MSEILAFLGAVPEMIALAKEVWAWLRAVSGDDPAGFLAKVAQALSSVNSAKTVEDRQNAAKAFADIFARM